MKTLLYRVITAVMLLIWLVGIFGFSAQSGKESGKLSASVSYHMVKAYSQILEHDMDESDILTWTNRIDYPVRKAAHMTEYAVLAVLAVLCMRGYRDWSKGMFLCAQIFAAVYAATDEIHQLYSFERGASVGDVLIDTIGAAVGLLLFGIFLKIVKGIAKRRHFH